MCNRWIHRLTGGAGLLAAAAALAVAADTSAKDALPPDVAAKVAEADIAFLQKGLDKDLTKNKREVPTLKATAVMIALYAQNSNMGGLQAQALKVAEAIGKKDYAAAKTAAAGLSKAAGGTGSGKAGSLHEQSKLDIAEVMSVFRPTKTGGLNIEKDIKDQSKKVTDVKLASAAAVNTLWAGHFTQLLPTDKAGSNASNKKKWEGYTADMNKVAEEITTEAAKGEKADKTLLAKKLKALDGSCVACHNDFRE